MQTSNTYKFMRQGKVRDVYTIGDGRHLLIVASDRISAFDACPMRWLQGRGRSIKRPSSD